MPNILKLLINSVVNFLIAIIYYIIVALNHNLFSMMSLLLLCLVSISVNTFFFLKLVEKRWPLYLMSIVTYFLFVVLVISVKVSIGGVSKDLGNQADGLILIVVFGLSFLFLIVGNLFGILIRKIKKA